MRSNPMAFARLAKALAVAGIGAAGLSGLALGQSFTQLPTDPIYTQYYVTQMSLNGATFYGYGYGSSDDYIYEQGSGYFNFSGNYPVFDISGDGSTILGLDLSNYDMVVFSPTGLQRIVSIPGQSGLAPGPLSEDGSICFPYTTNPINPYQYNLTNGSYTAIPSPGGSEAFIRYCSADGSIGYGYYVTTGGNESNAFTWSASTGTLDIGSFYPTSCSRDGSLVVGQQSAGSGTAYCWNRNTETLSTVFPGYQNVFSVDVSPGGAYFYGYHDDSSNSAHALIEDVSTGVVTDFGPGTAINTGSDARFFYDSYGGPPEPIFQPGVGSYTLADLLSSYKLSTTGLTSLAATNVTSDGTGLLGTATTTPGGSPALWYATVPLEGTGSLTPSSEGVENLNFVVTVNGSGFTPGCTVYWNGQSVPVTSVLPCHITAKVSASMVPATGEYPVTVKFPDGTVTSPLNFNVLVADPFVSLTVAPNPVAFGNTATATLTLKQPAPTGGFTATLSSPTSEVSLPSSITIPEGSPSATFSVSPGNYYVNYTAAITATNGSWSVSGNLAVNTTYLTSVAAAPSPVVAGGSCTGTVSISEPAPTGGWAVNLASTTPYAVVPASVTIASGSTSATFPITTSNYYTNYNPTIKATDSVSSKSTTFTVDSIYLSSVSVTPNPISGGSSGVGTVTLSQSAPSGGWLVNLNSSSSDVTVPTSVTVLAGSSTATFPVTTVNYSSNYSATIKATDSLSTTSTSLTVDSTFLMSVTASPNPVAAGATCTGTVTISQPAPTGGWTVNLSSSSSYVGLPASVTVAAGSMSATFPIATTNYSSNYEATITGKDSVSTQSTNLTVDSLYIASLALSPSTVANGTSSTGTVTLSGPAPAGGWTIQLVSSEPEDASVPASITIPAGATAGTFSVTTGLSTVNVVFSLTITASHLASNRTAALTLTP
jgi:hypothetical protein